MASSTGLLSCLGFPGWGALHLLVPRDGHPRGLAARLSRALSDPERPAAGNLLSALLRQQPELEPLLLPCRTSPQRLQPAHRYLLVCRYGAAEPLRIAAFYWQPQRSTWCRHCPGLPLPVFLQRFGGPLR